MAKATQRGESPAFLITEVQHDFESWCNNADAVEIKIVTTQGEFTIWCQTHGQDDGKLLVEFGRGERGACYGVEAD